MDNTALENALNLLFSGDPVNTELALQLGESQNLPVQDYYERASHAIEFLNAYNGNGYTFEDFFLYCQDSTLYIYDEPEWAEMPLGMDILAPYIGNLDISGQTQCPAWLPLLTNLKNVSFRNSLSAYPCDWLGKLADLGTLCFVVNNEAQLPTNIKFKNIKTLQLYFEDCPHPQKVLNLDNFPSLEKLDLNFSMNMYDAEGNYNTDLEQTILSYPADMRQHPNLIELYLNINNGWLDLNTITDFDLPNLRTLTLYGNHKPFLPHVTFAKNARLENIQITISEMLEEEIPKFWAWIMQQTELQNLSITFLNTPVQIPSKLTELPNLNNINLSGLGMNRFQIAQKTVFLKKNKPELYLYLS